MKSRDKLKNYFAAQPIDAAYLFGSQATGKAGKLSDVDVGVLFQPHLSSKEKFELRLKYISQIGRITGHPDKVDVVDLEKAPLALRYSVISPKKELHVADRKRRALFEAETLSRYFDYHYYIAQNTKYSLASVARG